MKIVTLSENGMPGDTRRQSPRARRSVTSRECGKQVYESRVAVEADGVTLSPSCKAATGLNDAVPSAASAFVVIITGHPHLRRCRPALQQSASKRGEQRGGSR
ncbi:hypothetical protein MTO96_007375 [Rhipicephalus appendiculatus]